MFAQLGDHIFQGLKTPVSTSEADAVKYGQIPRVNDKDAIQPTGAELRELSLTITYSSEFCDPQAEIYALKASMHAFEVLPYITGDGRIVGKFVITSLDIANQQCAADGWVELATVTVNLLESPGEEEAAPTGRALSSQKPIAVAPVASAPSPATGITNDVSAAKEKVSGMKQSIAKVKSRTTSLKRGVRGPATGRRCARTLCVGQNESRGNKENNRSRWRLAHIIGRSDCICQQPRKNRQRGGCVGAGDECRAVVRQRGKSNDQRHAGSGVRRNKRGRQLNVKFQLYDR